MSLARPDYFAMMMLQGAEVNLDLRSNLGLRSMWANMGLSGKAIVILLMIISACSVGALLRSRISRND